MKTLRVLFVISGLNTGGAELALLRLIQYLPKNIDAYVISLTSAGSVGPRLRSLGIPVIPLGMKSGRFSFLLFVRLCLHIRKIEPDLVQTWMYHADFLGGLAARSVGVRKIVWGVRHTNLESKLNKFSTLFVAKMCAWTSVWIPNAIISCSVAARQAHIAFGYASEAFHVVLNGVELNSFQPSSIAFEDVRAELGLAKETPLIGMVARYNPQKNHEGFIEAAAHIHKACPHAQFVLVGLGMDRNNTQLSQLICQHDIQDVVHLLGERADIPRIMAALNVLVLTSWGESFPNVLAEAMACGVPCVSTKAGDAESIVGDIGYAVPCGDMVALASATIHLLKEPIFQQRLRRARARAHITQYFDVRRMAHDYALLYQRFVM